MKWIVAAAGALLALAGALSQFNGWSIIQVERGWASVISGSVMLSGGLLLMAVAVILSRLERLAAVLSATRGLTPAPLPLPEIAADPEPFEPEPVRAHVAPEKVEPSPAPPPEPERAPVERPPVRRPPFGRFGAGAASLDPPPPPREIPVEPLPTLTRSPDPAPEPAPAVEAEGPRPAALRDFKFVFPPIEPPSAPPIESLAAEPEPEPAPAPEPEPEPEPTPEPTPLPPPAPVSAEETRDDALRMDIDWLLGREKLDGADPAAPEPKAADAPPPAPMAPPPSRPAPYSADWLDRALAGGDESEPAPLAPQAESAHHAPEAAPGLAPLPDDAVEIGRYKANGVAYVMYSDGSIAAETETGTFRFASLTELKAFIERGA